jgi:2-methylaconitate cis-trans-isomerase PrpF
MAGKISQATPISTLANGDLLDVSQDIGGGAYATKSISYQNLIAQLNSVIADNRLFGLYAQTVQSPTVTNTTTETTIVGAGVGGLTVPANTFSVGDSYHGKVGGIISGQNGDTIEVHIKSGSTVLASTGSISLEAVTALGWELELDFTIATIGATGSICTNGNFAYNRNTGSLEGFVFQDVEVIDTTASNTLDITVTWGQAKTQDEIYSANFVLYKTY